MKRTSGHGCPKDLVVAVITYISRYIFMVAIKD